MKLPTPSPKRTFDGTGSDVSRAGIPAVSICCWLLRAEVSLRRLGTQAGPEGLRKNRTRIKRVRT